MTYIEENEIRNEAKKFKEGLTPHLEALQAYINTYTEYSILGRDVDYVKDFRDIITNNLGLNFDGNESESKRENSGFYGRTMKKLLRKLNLKDFTKE